MASQEITYIDLFCGIGSFHYSFKKLGFKCVLSSDICEPAKITYNHNHNMEPRGDICDIDPTTIPSYDILTAGFPCQPFSQAGYRKGFEDDRGTMFSEVMKFVKTGKPRIVVLENVAHLLKHHDGKSFEKITAELEAEGYKVTYKILKCSDYGIPQMRKRLFIVGIKNTLEVSDARIANFFDLEEYEKTTTLSRFLGKNFEKPTAYTIRCGGKGSHIDDRHNWDGYWVLNNGNREEYRLTLDDALKLQGFENYELLGTQTAKWKMLGNTIPTILTTIIGKQILKYNLLTK